jgi:adenylosuccinate lyase
VIERYTGKEMQRLWSEEAKFGSWLEVEMAVSEVLCARGMVPEADMAIIREKAAFDIARIDEIEATVGHDVIAFLTSVAEKVGPESRHIHYGLTSSDVVDTAQALRTVRAADMLIAGIDRLMVVLRRQAAEHKNTVMIGRTHGIHAEPYTLGLKFAGWFAEAGRNRRRLVTAREEIAVGKISGAVGTYAHLGPEIEACPGTATPRSSPHWAFWPRHSIAWPPKSAIFNDRMFARSRNPSVVARRARRPCRTSATRSSARTSPVWPVW